MQSVPISTKVVSLDPAHVEVHLIQLYMVKFVSDLQQVSGFLLIQLYMIKFVSDLQQVSGFLLILQFPLPIKLTATI